MWTTSTQYLIWVFFIQNCATENWKRKNFKYITFVLLLFISDEIRELERRRRTGSTGRTNTSGQVRYVRHVSSPDSDHDTNTQMRRRQTSPRSRDSS